jgi:hypothetical protein
MWRTATKEWGNQGFSCQKARVERMSVGPIEHVGPAEASKGGLALSVNVVIVIFHHSWSDWSLQIKHLVISVLSY